ARLLSPYLWYGAWVDRHFFRGWPNAQAPHSGERFRGQRRWPAKRGPRIYDPGGPNHTSPKRERGQAVPSLTLRASAGGVARFGPPVLNVVWQIFFDGYPTGLQAAHFIGQQENPAGGVFRGHPSAMDVGNEVAPGVGMAGSGPVSQVSGKALRGGQARTFADQQDEDERVE